MEPLSWCRDRILVPGNPLTASLLFADPAHRDAILVLRALIGEVAASVDSNEGSIAQRRLAWWRDAISGELPAAERHPVLQATEAVELFSVLARAELNALIDGVAALIDKPRHERLDEVWLQCDRIGGQAVRLEAQLLGADQTESSLLSRVGASAYLIRLTRDLAMDARSNQWWVPLELQADYQVSRVDVVEQKGGPGFDGLIRSLVHAAMRRADEAIQELPSAVQWSQRHVLIHWSLDRRLGAMMARRPERILTRRLLPAHAGNVWAAWRAARRLGRRRSIRG